MNKQEIESNLAQFTGTEHYYKHFLGGLLLTDGAKFIAELGAYWLMDIIGSIQNHPKIRNEEFLTIKLVVKNDKAVFTAEDGDLNVLYSQKISYTDFPLDEIKLFVSNKVVMLPSEY